MTEWFEHTSGLCPVCLTQVPALLSRTDNQIYLIGECPNHGTSKALIASDANEYLRLRHYVPPRVSSCCCAPGTSCDIGKPPVCVLLIEITQACNLACPTCYADAQGHEFMETAEFRRRLDLFFAKQPLLDVLMLSGGEPTIHPQFVELLDIALRYPINRVLINTNGIRLAQSKPLAQSLAERRDRIELYLSFSSFQPKSHDHFYGKDLRAIKQAAFDIAEECSIFVNVVTTVEKEINEMELGDIMRYCLSRSNICGLVLQPVMNNGRFQNDYDPVIRVNLTGAIAALCDQSETELRPTDFVGLPCSHPDCAALTYCILDDQRKHLTPLPRYVDISEYGDLFSDRISFSGLLQSLLKRVVDDVRQGNGRHAFRDIAKLLSIPGVRSTLRVVGNRKEVGRRIFRIVVKPFMDAHTYDARRSEQCCTKIIDSSGEAVSFCDYNIFRRGRPSPKGVVALKMVKE